MEATKLCVKAGFDFHFIDAESQNNYLSAAELERLLSLCEELETRLTTVATVNARHISALEMAREYIEVVSNHDNGGLCFVAGNPSYLSQEERQLEPEPRVRQLIEGARPDLQSAPIFMGSEQMQGLAAEMAIRHSVIPFMLLDRSVLDEISALRSLMVNNGTAVYCPCFLAQTLSIQSLVRSFGAYAIRRRWVRKELKNQGLHVSSIRSQIIKGENLETQAMSALINAIQHLALVKTEAITQSFHEFESTGVRYLAVLLQDESPELIERFSRVVGLS